MRGFKTAIYLTAFFTCADDFRASNYEGFG